jgi:hypothetical protein
MRQKTHRIPDTGSGSATLFGRFCEENTIKKAVLRIRIRIRINMFLGLPDPDPLVRDMDPDLSINVQK